MSDVAAAPASASKRSSRLGYIDWLRGVAVLLMIQAHAIDAWLVPEARNGSFYRWSQFLAGAPAALFLFLAGVALVLLLTRLGERGRSPGAVFREGLRRSAQVVGYALAFRLLAFATSGFRDVHNLLRADVLNCIGLSMLLCSVAVFGLRAWAARLLVAIALTLALCLLTPFAWDALSPLALPLPLLVYVSGRPSIALFPLFPWAGYCAAGVVCGLILVRAMASKREGRCLALIALGGGALFGLGFALDRLPRIYPVEDFWHTSPSLFWMRTGVLLLLLGLAYAWHLVPLARFPSALRQMGRTSLLIYWVHVEIAYGNLFTRWARERLQPGEALLGTLILTVLMWLLSIARTNGGRFWPRRAGSSGTVSGAARRRVPA